MKKTEEKKTTNCLYTVWETIFKHFKIEVPDRRVPVDFFTFTKEILKENITFNPVPKDHIFKRFWHYVYPFVTTWHERIKNCSDMIFSALRIALLVLLSESTNGPLSNPAVLLFWFGSYEQLRNNSHADLWSSVCVILFLCMIIDIIWTGTQRLYNVSFRVYLRYVIYEHLHNVVTAFVNERCFTYV